MKNVLTDRQKNILDFIQQYRDEVGYPPTLREIGKKFGITSTFGVKRHLDALVKKGFLSVESNSSRAITISKNKNDIDNNSYLSIPLVGRVAAGFPILAIENIESNIVIDKTLVGKGEDSFALKVKGDSMINAGIFEGDLVIVNPSANTSNGDIIVAMLDDEVTVKTYENKKNKIKLIPQNLNYKPIEVDGSKSFSIVGKVVGVLRWLN
ncbi:MAG TPA: transcriptional repressor LexA [Ignavibacteriaceae bacterium]|nr:transcriptional repressor LexA [Ignavibacteriaceae bacterium]